MKSNDESTKPAALEPPAQDQSTDSGLTAAIHIGFMETDSAEFYASSGGFTGLRYKGTDYPRIVLRRALPVMYPNEYISVADKENKEIAIIREISEFPRCQQELIIAELDRRYYSPRVSQVASVKDKLGYVYFELLIEREGKQYLKTCAVKDVSKNIRLLGEDRLAIFDVDGNRYIVDSLSSLDRKSLKKLEPYLF